MLRVQVFQTFKTSGIAFAHGDQRLYFPSSSCSERTILNDKSLHGTKGYIYVPAPWWKTDYFEIRYENPANNKRYFYQLDGEGIRYELVSFVKAVQTRRPYSYINTEVSEAIVETINDFYAQRNLIII